ncbi:MAG TPA: 3-deoxy-manno-octulosonate cytidylyltransferase [Phycisphaerae bacterium]|nr:3-deoxy-manno-octulosonate cytidylyltransferase [Phycisphaerae bacterium]
MAALIIIPARLKSTRFPGKCLMRQTGKYLIEHVYEQAAKSKRASGIVIATDDQQIVEAVRSFDGQVVLTSPDHQSGTDRIAQVAAMPEFSSFTSIVNAQGDEPEIDPTMIDDLIRLLEATDVQMVTAAAPFHNRAEIFNPNVVKVVVDQRRFALYFSRSVIPHDRDSLAVNAGPLELAVLYRKHLGVYAYRRNFLLTLTQTAPCEIEKLEQLEQLRALYLGAKILVHDVPMAHHGIDTPDDYAAFVKRIQGL